MIQQQLQIRGVVQEERGHSPGEYNNRLRKIRVYLQAKYAIRAIRPSGEIIGNNQLQVSNPTAPTRPPYEIVLSAGKQSATPIMDEMDDLFVGLIWQRCPGEPVHFTGIRLDRTHPPRRIAPNEPTLRLRVPPHRATYDGIDDESKANHAWVAGTFNADFKPSLFVQLVVNAIGVDAPVECRYSLALVWMPQQGIRIESRVLVASRPIRLVELARVLNMNQRVLQLCKRRTVHQDPIVLDVDVLKPPLVVLR